MLTSKMLAARSRKRENASPSKARPGPSAATPSWSRARPGPSAAAPRPARRGHRPARQICGMLDESMRDENPAFKCLRPPEHHAGHSIRTQEDSLRVKQTTNSMKVSGAGLRQRRPGLADRAPRLRRHGGPAPGDTDARRRRHGVSAYYDIIM